jgi:hypothetical protein
MIEGFPRRRAEKLEPHRDGAVTAAEDGYATGLGLRGEDAAVTRSRDGYVTELAIGN